MDLMKYLARVRDSRPHDSDGYQPGVLYRLTPSGPAYATEAETVAAIIAETGKAYNDAGGRPLPLVANWNMYSTPLSWQLGKIAEGWPILPFVTYDKSMSVANFTGTGYPNGNADAIADLAAAGLPFSLQYPNFSDPLYTDAAYATSTSDAATACALWPFTVSGAVATGSTSVTITVNYALEVWAIVGAPVTFSEFTGGWSALNGTHTITARNVYSKTITVAVDGSGFGTWSSGGKALTRVAKLSPMGTDAPWAALGTEHAECDVIAHLQSEYPDPPRVFIVDNNESRKISHTQWPGEQRFIDANPTLVANLGTAPAQHNDQPMAIWHEALADRHSAMFGAFRTALTEAAWPGAVSFVGYNATLAHNFRTSDLWWQLSDTWEACFVEGEFNKLAWQPYAWNGSTPNIYVWNNFGWYPFETYSQQNIAMVYKVAQDIAESVNPNYWAEFSSWDGELFDGGAHPDSVPATYIRTTHGIDYTVGYYKGWVQWCMWLLRSRCVREFRYHYHPATGYLDLTDTETEHGARFQMHLEMVSHVHQHTVLRRFWREGTLVENTAALIADNSYAHPFQFMSGYTGYAVRALAWDAYVTTGHHQTLALLPPCVDQVDEY